MNDPDLSHLEQIQYRLEVNDFFIKKMRLWHLIVHFGVTSILA